MQATTVMVLALTALPFAAASQERPAPRQWRFDQTDEQAAPRLRAMDSNRDGVVTKDEWQGDPEAFRQFDWNDDGILSGNELRADVRRARDRDPVVAPARTGACTTNAAQVVDDIYQQVLERPADPSTAATTQALAAGQMSVRDIVADVAKSPEHAARFYWRPLVAGEYRRIMKRNPSEGELRDAADELAGERLQFSDLIARTARRAAADEQGAVRLLYVRLLGREPDEGGLRTFTDLARRDGIEAVARDIMASPEYQQRAAAAAADRVAAYAPGIRTLSQHVLGREVDGPTMEALAQVASLYGPEGVVDRLMAMPDYARQFGTDGVPGRSVRYCGTNR